jgi:hypothetical protein
VRPWSHEEELSEEATWFMKKSGRARWCLGPVDNNKILSDTVSPQLIANIVAGGSSCLFAYGQTGSGKTHSVYGSPTESGVVELMGAELLKRVREECARKEHLFLEATLVEVYCEEMFDLLAARQKLHLRNDEKNVVRVRSATVLDKETGRVEVFPAKAMVIHDAAALRGTIASGLSERTTGVSNVHDESSRSFAVLRLEVVNDELVELRKRIIALEGDVVPLGKNRTNLEALAKAEELLRAARESEIKMISKVSRLGRNSCFL